MYGFILAKVTIDNASMVAPFIKSDDRREEPVLSSRFHSGALRKGTFVFEAGARERGSRILWKWLIFLI
ncbi:hypothetical protein [Pseudochrobactrum kiredjianiae]|uniref:Uncharacterized protein n=1 Tax=Pseudochrobactrum kiredjianiae TaxID=386305 RepID=A0ABW3V259_9HYPH|nr:hypothetical protein [Pseudochrobactrum kiredjianiae]MDM7851697.1 hypothetical protein [Pseudochrobactrum kiredjianiae]